MLAVAQVLDARQTIEELEDKIKDIAFKTLERVGEAEFKQLS